jgi:F-type H+-transporting ATPase subunit c
MESETATTLITSAQSAKYYAAALALLCILGVTMALGNIFSSFMNGVSRNPSVEPKLKSMAIIGAGMTEALGILAVIVAILILFVV